MITANQVAANASFQTLALIEALKTLSNSTGISLESLIEQFPTNSNLQESCAKMLIKAAEATADMLNAKNAA